MKFQAEFGRFDVNFGLGRVIFAEGAVDLVGVGAAVVEQHERDALTLAQGFFGRRRHVFGAEFIARRNFRRKRADGSRRRLFLVDVIGESGAEKQLHDFPMSLFTC